MYSNRCTKKKPLHFATHLFSKFDNLLSLFQANSAIVFSVKMLSKSPCSCSFPCLFYTRVTDVWMPTVAPNTFNGTFTVTHAPSGGDNKPYNNVKTEKERILRHMHFILHIRTYTHTNIKMPPCMYTHSLHQTITSPHWLTPCWDTFCSADRFYTFTANGSQLPYIHIPWKK